MALATREHAGPPDPSLTSSTLTPRQARPHALLRRRNVCQGSERLLHRVAQLGRAGLLAPTAGRRARECADGIELELADAVEVQRQRLGGRAE